ncbi:MAG TPA: hypothetical protein ENI02_02140 [Candidatus Aminicenantes bacterium]|nr:hypothetical protein [Candidatus Aminicenantes bacterium]
MKLLWVMFILGFLHGLGSDHLMAMTTLVSRGAKSREALVVGLRFGLGHMATLVFIGSLGIILNFTIPPSLQKGSEILGGTLLVLLGGWTLYDSLKGKFYSHGHIHAHSEQNHQHPHFHLWGRHKASHLHLHLATFLGSAFALSGIGALLVAIPVVLAESVGEKCSLCPSFRHGYNSFHVYLWAHYGPIF